MNTGVPAVVGDETWVFGSGGAGGFGQVNAGKFPSNVAPGGVADFTVRLDSARAGVKFGELRIPTNDADASLYNFNLGGTVNCAAPSGAPTVALPGAAVPFWPGAPARLLAPLATLSDGDASYAGAVLRVEFAGGAQADDRLLVLSQGAAAGDS